MTTPRIALLLVAALASRAALADPLPTQQAGAHFERGVSLFNEADYRAALVEFRKAYEIAPNAGVLYNIGQTYFQLQNYAAALSAFRQFVKDAPDGNPHKAEVEQYIQTLESRVGRLQISTSQPGVEITIDDESVGRTPLAGPVDVSIGHRKVIALAPGKPAETRYVDVAAADTVKVDIAVPVDAPVVLPARPAVEPARPMEEPSGQRGLVIGWTSTGVLAVGALTVGGFAWKASRDLDTARNTFPETASDLSSRSSRVKNLALGADLLTGAAVIAGSVSLYFTLTRRHSTREVHAGITARGVVIGGAF